MLPIAPKNIEILLNNDNSPTEPGEPILKHSKLFNTGILPKRQLSFCLTDLENIVITKTDQARRVNVGANLEVPLTCTEMKSNVIIEFAKSIELESNNMKRKITDSNNPEHNNKRFKSKSDNEIATSNNSDSELIISNKTNEPLLDVDNLKLEVVIQPDFEHHKSVESDITDPKTLSQANTIEPLLDVNSLKQEIISQPDIEIIESLCTVPVRVPKEEKENSDYEFAANVQCSVEKELPQKIRPDKTSNEMIDKVSKFFLSKNLRNFMSY